MNQPTLHSHEVFFLDVNGTLGPRREVLYAPHDNPSAMRNFLTTLDGYSSRVVVLCNGRWSDNYTRTAPRGWLSRIMRFVR